MHFNLADLYEAFNRQAVENWIQTGQTGPPIAAELGVSDPSLKDWKRRYWGDATPERADLETENRALRAELARVRAPRDILKKRWASSANRPSALPNRRTHECRTRTRRPVRRVGSHAQRLPGVGQSRSK